MAEFDCRALAIFSLLLTLIVMGGIVLFRHHHGHHMQHRSSPLTPPPPDNFEEIIETNLGCEECECETKSLQLAQKSIIEPTLTENENGELKNFVENGRKIDENLLNQLNEMCLQCICMTATECKPSNCTGGLCGIFRISKPYWMDAGKPKLIGDNAQNDIDDNAYWHCVNNPYCSARTVQNYMEKYARDFNRDGIIDCTDYTILHILGPSGSFKQQLSIIHRTRLNKCLHEFQ